MKQQNRVPFDDEDWNPTAEGAWEDEIAETGNAIKKVVIEPRNVIVNSQDTGNDDIMVLDNEAHEKGNKVATTKKLARQKRTFERVDGIFFLFSTAEFNPRYSRFFSFQKTTKKS
jgi:hypothetical protein